MKLYHGSQCQNIEKFNFRYARRKSDFGKGVYFTTNFEKAKQWACKRSSEGAVYEIDIDLDTSNLNTVLFSREKEDLYYYLYLCRLGLESLVKDFIDDIDDINDIDIAIGPVLQGTKNGGILQYSYFARSYNRGDISFEKLYEATSLYGEAFVQWCVKSKDGLEVINKSILKKYLIEKKKTKNKYKYEVKKEIFC